MEQNDFLASLLNINPLIFSSLIWFFGFGSIFLVAIKGKTVKKDLLRNPGFILGDFFVIPIIGGLISYFYQQVSNPLLITTSPYWNLTLIIAILITFYMGIKFKLMKLWWFPHGLFHVIFTYILINFLFKGVLQLVDTGGFELWIIWFLVLAGIIAHYALGIRYPKKLGL